MAHNRMVPLFLTHVDPTLLQPPVNVMGLSLHPLRLVSRIANLVQWKQHLFEQLLTQINATSDAGLQSLLDELRSFIKDRKPVKLELSGEALGVVVPFQFQTEHDILSFISTVTVFASPAESFTATVLRQLALAV